MYNKNSMKFLKKVFLCILACLMLSCHSFFIIAEEKIMPTSSHSSIKGDLNNDGMVNAVDYVILKKYLSSQSETDIQFLDIYDVNGDNEVNQYDELRLKNTIYYGEVDNLNVFVDSKDIHTKNQRLYLESNYNTINQYGNGGAASRAIILEYNSDIIPDGPEYQIKVSENYDMSDSKTYISSKRTVNVENSKVQQIYFWTVNNGNETSAIQSFYVDDIPVRNLSTGSIGNARDIGGFETEDGYIVKQGMIYRGYMMSHDNKNLQKNRDILTNDLGIITEIDINSHKSDALIENETTYLARYLKYELYGGYLNYDSNGKPTYKSFSNIVNIFQDMADQSNYPVYIHCRIGADRTGLMCFLFNALLGVSKSDCYKDYSFTTFSGDPRSAKWIENDYVRRIEQTEGRTFAEKTYNLLVKLGVNANDLDKFISIMKEKKPSLKTYLDKPQAIETVLHYDGSEKQLKLNDNYLFNVIGDKATDVGEYTATISLKDPVKYSWSDGSKSDKTINWRIEDVRDSVAMPNVLITEHIYSGEEQEIVVEEKDYYIITGNKAIDAGEYELVVSLTDKSKYVWEDETNNDLKYKWTIDKADIDLSEFVFEDATYVYDGSVKELVVSGELPEGVKSVEYTDNTTTGHPNQITTLEATASFVTDDNHNPIADMKAILLVEPIVDNIVISFNELSDKMNVNYGDEYELPVIDKQDYDFKGWYVMDINGEFIRIDQSGIWNYETNVSNVSLYPLFEYKYDVQTEKSIADDLCIISIHEKGNSGIGILVESDNAITNNNFDDCLLVGLYKMNTNARFMMDKNHNEKHHYLLLNNTLLYGFNEE